MSFIKHVVLNTAGSNCSVDWHLLCLSRFWLGPSFHPPLLAECTRRAFVEDQHLICILFALSSTVLVRHRMSYEHYKRSIVRHLVICHLPRCSLSERSASSN